MTHVDKMMHSGSAPIGFEGILAKPNQSHIGFEQFENEEKEHVLPSYPLNDTMPSPRQTLQNNYVHSDDSFTVGRTMPTPSYVSRTRLSSRKSVSHPQLSATYHEIVEVWSNEKWLRFVDDRTETYLTLNVKSEEILSIQTAIDQFRLTTCQTPLLSPPECLLIRTKSKSKTVFIPNVHISLENLSDDDSIEVFPRFKLIAIIAHSNETDSNVMFYKDSHSNSWYIYHHQSKPSSHSYSNILPDEEQDQLESFIQLHNYINPYQFTSPLSALRNNPVTYVYMREKSNENS